MSTTNQPAPTMIIRTQPLPKLSMVACAQKRALRGVTPILRRKKSHARRAA